jgi:nucleoside-diphosphate kinase
MRSLLTVLLTIYSLTGTLQAEQQQTLALIKPDAVAKNKSGAIISRFQQEGLQIVALQQLQLSAADAGRFYAIHKDRPFYKNLVNYMSSGPIVALVLTGDNAVTRVRTIIGATDPKQAAPGTLRAQFGESITFNAMHSSDSVANAAKEIAFFVAERDITTPLSIPTAQNSRPNSEPVPVNH